jgi:hypothetical protein
MGAGTTSREAAATGRSSDKHLHDVVFPTGLVPLQGVPRRAGRVKRHAAVAWSSILHGSCYTKR